MRWQIPMLFVLLAGCAFPDEDFDGDGWTAAMGDCSDLDPAVHPEATERLDDGIDQDCDGFDPVMQVLGSDHSCLLGSSGQVLCEGGNDFGQLELPPQERLYVKLAAGDYHTCGLTPDGAIDCWGSNAYGQSDPPDRFFVDLDAGSAWSIGVLESGDAVCWGRCLILP